MSANRLASGGLIDRARPLSFRFDGQTFGGFAGDTLASALVANGAKLVGRSFKYHRPRGILTSGSEEPNALVELRTGARREPNTRATTVELYDGLVAASQNRWPSLRLRPRRHQRPALAVSGGGLLLQDLHVAAEVLGSAVRAADPPRRGARPRGGRRGSRPLREGLRPLRRAGDRRRARGPDRGAGGGPRRRARDPVRRGLSPRRPPARRDLRDRWQARRSNGSRKPKPSLLRSPRCASCAAPR